MADVDQNATLQEVRWSTKVGLVAFSLAKVDGKEQEYRDDMAGRTIPSDKVWEYYTQKAVSLLQELFRHDLCVLRREPEAIDYAARYAVMSDELLAREWYGAELIDVQPGLTSEQKERQLLIEAELDRRGLKY